jgi:periplasmic copper chaperone A
MCSRAYFVAAATLFGTICASLAGTPTVRVDEAWIRWLPAGVPEGGYATLTNIGDNPLTLIGATSPQFREISIHRSVNRHGTMEMDPVKEITINPHSTLEFASSGYHLMLIQPTATLEPKQQVAITLRFADGSSLTVPFEVRKTGASSSP